MSAGIEEQTVKRPNRAPRAPSAGARLVTFAQGHIITGIPENSLRALVSNGHLARVVLPGSRRIWLRRVDLDALIERSTETLR